jgi:hypothetical protein
MQTPLVLAVWCLCSCEAHIFVSTSITVTARELLAVWCLPFTLCSRWRLLTNHSSGRWLDEETSTGVCARWSAGSLVTDAAFERNTSSVASSTSVLVRHLCLKVRASSGRRQSVVRPVQPYSDP